ncbi:hypothetical protein HN682_07560 [Candidatus Peregrinibacteria bacterium]|nr:hypothetical protein [Candidatus Peregrinibacteria bacterium]
MKKLISLIFLAILGSVPMIFICYKENCSLISSRIPKLNGELLKSSEMFSIHSPKPNNLVETSFIVKGTSRSRASVLNFNVKDNLGNMIAGGYLYVQASIFGEARSFSSEISIEKKAKTGSSILEIFEKSSVDGSNDEKISVPIRFN